MGKTLIILEKPSVAQEYAKVLKVYGRNNGYIENNSYVITWCYGHLVEMVYPEEYDPKYSKWKLEDLPFLPKQYKYGVKSSAKNQYDIVTKMLHRSDIDTVYWAGDSGKEGQYIEELIRMLGGVRKGMKELRVWIDSQTEEEILRGIKEAKPMSYYENLGNSGIMRAIEDYAIGINFSRAMSIKYGSLLNQCARTSQYKAIAVGRVMTCVLGMVVEREREIRNFREMPFYRVVADLFGKVIEGEWKAIKGSDYFESPLLYKENGFYKREDAEHLVNSLSGKPAIVELADIVPFYKKAPLLFNLAELQAECTKRLKISPDETLAIAQELYEGKLITYPRTDARVLSTAIAKSIYQNLSGLTSYAPAKCFVENIINNGKYKNIEKTQYVNDSQVTDHYAIIPTGQTAKVSSLNTMQAKVYDLIVRRFLSIFYPAAEFLSVKLVIGIGKEKFFATSKVLKTPGYLEITGTTSDDDGDVADTKLLNVVKTLKRGDKVQVEGINIKEGKTKPPKRYTSGAMILAMENAGQLIEDEDLRAQIKGSGIGTSATRADIIQKLINIGYLNLNRKTQVLTPEVFGEMVYEVVKLTIPALLNPAMSASWEKGLESITKGNVSPQEFRIKLEEFIVKSTDIVIKGDLSNKLKGLFRLFMPISNTPQKAFGGYKINPSTSNISTKLICPVCGNEVVKRSWGWGCSSYKTGCKFAISNEIAGKKISDEQVAMLINTGSMGKVTGLKGKSGKIFDAIIVLDSQFKPVFVFN